MAPGTTCEWQAGATVESHLMSSTLRTLGVVAGVPPKAEGAVAAGEIPTTWLVVVAAAGCSAGAAATGMAAGAATPG